MKFTNNHQQSPYEIDATVEMCGVLTKQTHEDWRQDEKQHVAYLKRHRNMFEHRIWCKQSTGKAVLKFIDFELPAAHMLMTQYGTWNETKQRECKPTYRVIKFRYSRIYEIIPFTPIHLRTASLELIPQMRVHLCACTRCDRDTGWMSLHKAPSTAVTYAGGDSLF